MERKEYEYSFKVKSLVPFFEYCQNNEFTFIDEYQQPEQFLVVSIEGKKDIVDKIYNEVNFISKRIVELSFYC